MRRLIALTAPLIIRTKKHALIVLRFLIAAIISSIPVSQDRFFDMPWQFNLVVIVYILTNVTLFFESIERFYTQRLSSVIFIYDIGIVALSLYYIGGISNEIYLIFALVILLSAISKSTIGAFLNCIAVSAVFTFLSLKGFIAIEFLSSSYFAFIIFFFVIALFAGYLAEEAERERAKRMLSERSYREIFERSAVGIVIAGLDGAIIGANPLGAKMLGSTEDALVGVNFISLVKAVEGQAKPLIEDVSSPKTGDFANVRIVPRTGDEFEARIFPARIFIDGRETYQFIIRNITAENEYYDKLNQLSKMQALGLLMSGIAHDLSNPLTSVIGFADILRKNPGDKQKERADLIHDNAQRCRRIVDRLQAFSASRKSDKSDVIVNVAVEEALDMVLPQFKQSRIEIVRNYAGDILIARTDSAMIGEVFVNVITNACQAVEHCAVKKVSVTTSKREGKALIEIADNGCGIPKGAVARIFDPFFTTKPGGVGLGLSLAFSVVSESGGEISVESEEGKGSVFRILLPLSERI